MTAIDFRACNNNLARYELTIQRIPIDVITIPVDALAMANHSLNAIDILTRRNDQHAITLLKRSIVRGEQHLTITPQTRNDERNVN